MSFQWIFKYLDMDFMGDMMGIDYITNDKNGGDHADIWRMVAKSTIEISKIRMGKSNMMGIYIYIYIASYCVV